MKKGFDFLYYLALIILIILLLLPPGLRLFGKNLYTNNNTKKDVIEILTCNKENGSISSTFLNGVPQNLEYKVKGNYATDQTETEEDNIDQLVEQIMDYSKIDYDEENDITTFTVGMTDFEKSSTYSIFNTLEKQNNNFTSQSFSCSKTTYEM